MKRDEQTIAELLAVRENLRKEKKFDEADLIRNKLQSLGYMVADSTQSSAIKPLSISEKTERAYDHLFALFGSGEMSPTGRKIHEMLVSGIQAPLAIALLETPAGYEDNPHHWYKKLENMLSVGLQNYKPVITRVTAHRYDSDSGTNSPETLQPLTICDYLHTGAGSPSYTVKHMKNSLCYSLIQEHIKKRKPASFASAAAMALGKYTLPIYEMYFAGHDPSFGEGLDLFSQFGLPLVIVPHFNNTEGGESIDTRFCYLGKKLFDAILRMLPKDCSIVGIDEQTALIFDIAGNYARVVGNGTVTLIRNAKTDVFEQKCTIPFRAFI